MRISELAQRSGVPTATIKLYIREGLLARGNVTSRTQAEYGEEHLVRLRLIASLKSIQGLPLSKLADILAIVDSPPDDVLEATGAAVAALPPYADDEPEEPILARAVLGEHGLPYDPDYPATHHLNAALEVLQASDMPADAHWLGFYISAARNIARAELAPLEGMDPAEAAAYSALGTALYEPLFLALRRLAHYEFLTTTTCSDSAEK